MDKKFYACVILALCFSFSSRAQCDGTITLTSQAEVDSFPSTHGCSNIPGTLQILYTTDVTNLDSLYQLTYVGTLSIVGNQQLTDLGGLSNITGVSAINLSSNAAIQDLTGFSSLTTVGNMFSIASNPKLGSLHGLEHLASIGTLEIAFCDLLTDLVPLSGLTKTFGDLVIRHNNGLTSLSGLGNITSIGGIFRIEANAGLLTVNGVNNLTTAAGIWILNNPLLPNVNGFSSIVSPGVVTITGNSKLTNLDGFSSIKSASSVWIDSNAALTSIQGLARLTTLAPPGDLRILNNPALISINGLENIRSLAGSLYIKNNMSLVTLDGLRSLTSTGSWEGEGRIEITDNVALQNVDSLSSLTSMGGTNNYLMVMNNPALTRGCGLYPLIQNNLGCGSQATCSHITISGNGPGVTEQSIRDNGPCSDPNTDPAQPTNIAFSRVTGVTMRVSFTAPSQPPSGGYLVLMRHDEAPYPEEGPVEGTQYHVGDVIGNSTIVVGTDLETTSDIVWLAPNTPYYFAIFSYTNTYHYVIESHLEGMQSTGDPEPARTNTLVFPNVTDNTMTVSFTGDSTSDGYLTVMRAFSSPYPDEVPEDGIEYHVGDVIGNSTIVVGMSTATSNDIIWLQPDTDYFFEVLNYNITNGVYNYNAENPQSGHQRTNSSAKLMAYPNPFIDNITIPFAVREENTHVRVLIFDQMGRVVSEVVSERFPPGDHEVRWDRFDLQGKRVVDGIYMYAVKSSEKNRSAQGIVIAK